MKRKGLLAILVAVSIFAATVIVSQANGDKLQKEPHYLYVCSFNIYVLGNIEDKYSDFESSEELGDVTAIPQRIKNLAKVLAVGAFDLISIQEVTAGDVGHWVISDLVRELKESHNLEYEFFLSDGIGQGFGIVEAMAFLYDADALAPEIISGGTSLTENLQVNSDTRDIVRTQWQAGDFDFTLYAVHLEWGDEDDREDGYELVDQILTVPTPSEFSFDPDIIVLGDFNRLGNEQDVVKAMGFQTGDFLAPTITFFDPEFDEIERVTKTSIEGKGVPNDNPQLLSTTVAQKTYAYDMILLSNDVAEEFPAGTGQASFGIDFGIIHYDEADGFGYQAGADELKHNDLKEAYSDHRPLWIRFKNNSGHSDSTPEGPASPTIDVTYVGTEDGKKFHLPGCRTIKNSTLTETWNSREDALDDRKPCGVCKP